ncbi:MAG: hypothetical protein A2Y62_19440 [Candidatus Fischerbacteria bacterium RBG_13_37_8]|uniref:N-acetyltransferase domain-containing protein n=1 Tax=Candidatus Fischerbacteria bacterium RBG_13_37_8 TaxID=1817863 RepID=A0A1F5VN33_9BACT|nr:MAG: hypothetical protein A2Y62_19440 [Candidatus Fischerbacteria bacterium RBG_13_37_8]
MIRSLCSNDKIFIQEILTGTGFFSPLEIATALELIDDFLNNPATTYQIFVSADDINPDTVTGYICYGKNPLSYATYELYWIAVAPGYQKKGVGKALMHFFEERIKEERGINILIETSSKIEYESTRKFYLTLDYKQLSIVENFYAPGDARITYIKVIN